MRFTVFTRSLVWSSTLFFASTALVVAQVPKNALQPRGVPAHTLPTTKVDERDVIVIMKDQISSMPAARGLRQSRAAAVSSSQSTMISRLQSARPRLVRSFKLINAFATKVTSAEAAKLASSPDVKAVVADAVIRLPKSSHNRSETAQAAAAASSVAATSSASATDGYGQQICDTLEPEALQLTNAAFPTAYTPQAQSLRDGHGTPVTGKGVTVAFIADGLDINNPGFIRPDGSSVFVDYQDFTGDPAGTPTGGGEAFGDASSIAAQDVSNGATLTYDISKFVSPAHPLPSTCNIRIRGIAPGASLVGLNVFSAYSTTTSNFVQAIEYAVFADDVDVINESFGGNPFYDSGTDPISIANHLAVEAGVTVVVSTGDAGTAGTLGSPSTDPYVIAAGASTQFRFYAQTSYGAQPFSKGYISNNISAISSGGFAQRSPRTVDVVAPGDLSWSLCSTDVSLYEDCFDLKNSPSPIESFGGTSEASPLTAGEAALVIQAYRSTHGGASPTPALVKKIIMSSATDLGAPADEQGAGLINALAAVNTALSIEDANGSPKSRGNEIVITPTSDPIVDDPNTQHSRFFVVTNTGVTTRHLSPRLQSLAQTIGGATVIVHTHPPVSPTFLNVGGAPRSYVTTGFNVTAAADHLDAEISYPPFNKTGTAYAVYLSLRDPSGRQSAYSLPQGFGSGYAHVDIVKPRAGTWTAIIFTRNSGSTAYDGAVKFTWSTQRFVSAGSVSPATLDLKPGDTNVVQATFSMPSQPGDSSMALRFADTAGATNGNAPSAPITLRTLIPLTGGTGDFSGTLTGGNGRAGAGPTKSYEFDVPASSKALNLALNTSEPGEQLEGFLVDPNGMQLSVQPSLDPVTGKSLGTLQLYHANPQPGRWHFVLLLNFTAAGKETSLPFDAHISLKELPYTVTGLPDSPAKLLSISAKPVNVSVMVQNTSTVRQAFFADPRLRDPQDTLLSQYLCSQYDLLPGACIYTFIPPQTNTAYFVAQSTVPITMDAVNSAGVGPGYTGNPDIYAHEVGTNTVQASLSVPEVPYGLWFMSPSEIGPYGPEGAPVVPLYSDIVVNTRPFDSAITSDHGDEWADLTYGTDTYKPLILAPGATGVIHLQITPDPAQIGTTVNGYIYLDTFNASAFTGDEVARIPYSYTVVH